MLNLLITVLVFGMMPAYKQSDIDWEVVASFEAVLATNARVQVTELPAVNKMVCVIHHGRVAIILQVKLMLLYLLGLRRMGIALLARLREVYIVYGNEQDNDSYVTEVQFTVEKSEVVTGAVSLIYAGLQ